MSKEGYIQIKIRDLKEEVDLLQNKLEEGYSKLDERLRDIKNIEERIKPYLELEKSIKEIKEETYQKVLRDMTDFINAKAKSHESIIISTLAKMFNKMIDSSIKKSINNNLVNEEIKKFCLDMKEAIEEYIDERYNNTQEHIIKQLEDMEAYRIKIKAGGNTLTPSQKSSGN